MSAESRLVQRLLTTSNDTTILLFLRFEGEPYCCMGRVSFVSYNLNVNPVAIKWKLLDFDDIVQKDYFKRVLGASGLSN